MKEVSSWKELSIEMQKRIDKSLAKNVAPIIEKKVQQSAEQYAAGDYSRDTDGISDPANIISEISNGEITTIDIAKPSPPHWINPNNKYEYDTRTYFSEWIEEGRWMDASIYAESDRTKKVKRAARPFIEPVQEDINSNPTEIFSALKKGLE